MMELLASITKKAIDKKIISYEDLYTLTEDKLMNILEKCQDEEILFHLNKFKIIKLNEIPEYDIPTIKYRNLNPIVKNKRFLEV